MTEISKTNIANFTITKITPAVKQEITNIRLTPTGKISRAKSRVYTQRYRKEWEQHRDFQGWLTCIPDSPTRAYCLYCKKDLHAHRLSLLKHTCTMKHQRAALSAKTNGNMSGVNFKFEVEIDQGKEDYSNIEYLDGDFQQVQRFAINDVIEYEGENEDSFEEVEEVTEDTEGNVTAEENKEETEKRDALVEAMAHIHSEDVEETEVQENNEVIYSEENLAEINMKTEKRTVVSNSVVLDNEDLNKFKDDVIIIKKIPQTARKSMKKMVILSSTSSVQNDAMILQDVNEQPDSKVTLNSQKKVKELSKNEVSTSKPTNTYQKSRITTHVLDTQKGSPVSGLQVSLYKLVDGRWTFVNESNTLINGRCNDLVDHENTPFTAGRYKLHFDVDKYFTSRKIETMYPFIEIVFDVKNPSASYHMPLLLSPYSYTVYRGTDK